MNGSPAIGEAFRGAPESEALFKIAYGELRAVASAYLRKERPGHTLQTTALLHEAFVRLLRNPGASWPNRAAFCAAAATAMRRVLMDYARTRERQKRGGRGAERVPLSAAHLVFADNALELAALDRALAEFEELEPRAARVVELRFFCGLTEDETADALGRSRRTVSKDWRFARAWLRERLERDGLGG